jgi:hypothetical protein
MQSVIVTYFKQKKHRLIFFILKKMCGHLPVPLNFAPVDSAPFDESIFFHRRGRNEQNPFQESNLSITFTIGLAIRDISGWKTHR